MFFKFDKEDGTVPVNSLSKSPSQVSLVRLPSNLVSRIYDKNYAELFLLDKEVVIVDHPKEYSQKNERKKNNGKK